MAKAGTSPLHVTLLPGFICRRQLEVIDLGGRQQKLIAALALSEGPLHREALACRLWPDVPAPRATARLRQTLWRLNQATDGRLLQVSNASIALHEDVHVDYRLAAKWAVPTTGRGGAGGSHDDFLGMWNLLRYPLLFGWDVDWLQPYQEKWELRRMQALEALAESFLGQGRHALVLELADAAAQADPLREGPRRIAVKSCLQADEIADAHRRFHQYRMLLRDELGVDPSDAIPRMLWPGQVRAA